MTRYAIVGVAILGAIAIYRVASSIERGSASDGGGAINYRMGCPACGTFEMAAAAYRDGLAWRTDRSANRIKCPKCGAPNAAYRLDSGMEGLGELNSNGQAAVSPRMHPHDAPNEAPNYDPPL